MKITEAQQRNMYVIFIAAVVLGTALNFFDTIQNHIERTRKREDAE